MRKKELVENEAQDYHKYYIDKAPELDLLEALEVSKKTVLDFLKEIPDDKHEYCYAQGKWNLKEILSHIIDTERIFTYRALRIARNDKTSLQGYDHNEFVTESNATERSLESLIEEYSLQRNSTILFYKNLSNEMLLRIGNANGLNISTRAIGFLLCGHEKHHLDVFKERYL